MFEGFFAIDLLYRVAQKVSHYQIIKKSY